MSCSIPFLRAVGPLVNASVKSPIKRKLYVPYIDCNKRCIINQGD